MKYSCCGFNLLKLSSLYARPSPQTPKWSFLCNKFTSFSLKLRRSFNRHFQAWSPRTTMALSNCFSKSAFFSEASKLCLSRCLLKRHVKIVLLSSGLEDGKFPSQSSKRAQRRSKYRGMSISSSRKGVY